MKFIKLRAAAQSEAKEAATSPVFVQHEAEKTKALGLDYDEAGLRAMSKDNT
jgi:hypothetical protein